MQLYDFENGIEVLRKYLLIQRFGDILDRQNPVWTLGSDWLNITAATRTSSVMNAGDSIVPWLRNSIVNLAKYLAL